MEVHHHPHVEKKNFKEYFFEFLMIFLAVTLGFFAESLRENINDTEKEKHYMVSLVKDLETDTASVSLVMNDQTFLLNEMDSASRIATNNLHLLNEQDSFYNYFLTFFNFQAGFNQNDNTLVQLRNAGGYSVIKKTGVADSVIKLVTLYARVKYNEDFYHDDFIKVEDFANNVIKIPYISTGADGNSIYPNQLYNTEVFTNYDKQQLEHLYSLIEIERTQLEFYRFMIARYKESATALIVFLKKEYDLN
ncbi:MAG TPA: hypothetical protein VGI61_09145 [Parafilimonas sp.]